jgi:hypothetical protein
MLELDRAQVLATRVEAHHLNRRLDTDSSRDNAADSALVHGNPPSVRDDMMYALIESAAVCGVRDVQQSGILAFHARINGVHHDDLERTLDGRQLVKVASARGNISIVPARDVAVFTLGVLPGDEGSLRTYLKPFLPVLDESGMSAQGALDSVCEAAAEALADGPLDSAALSAALTRRLPALSAMCRGRCGSVHIEEGLFRLAGMGGTWCVGSHEGVRVHVRTDQWLDAATWQARPDRQRAREEMVRRYLVAFGPAPLPRSAPGRRSRPLMRAPVSRRRMSARSRSASMGSAGGPTTPTSPGGSRRRSLWVYACCRRTIRSSKVVTAPR